MSATQKDIAKRLNLSVSLVGKVLNDRPNVWASEKTRDLIRRTAREMDYQRHSAAGALRTGKTRIVAFIGVETDVRQYGEIEAFVRNLSEIGYSLLVKSYRDVKSSLVKIKEMAAARACDAYILWGDEEEVEQQGEILEKLQLPFVAKGYYEDKHPYWLQADFDHQAMMVEAVRFLSGYGHKRIAYLGFQTNHVYSRQLLSGFRRGMEEILARRADDDLIATTEDGEEATERALHKWLNMPEQVRPTAIVIGAANREWRQTEIALARKGLLLGYGSGDVAAVGTCNSGHSLLFGTAHAYSDVELSDLAEKMSESLLIPLLEGCHPKPVVRVNPALRPMPTLSLMESAQVQLLKR